MSKPTIVLMGDHERIINAVYPQAQRNRLSVSADIYPEVVTTTNFSEHQPRISDAKYVFSTWGMPRLDASKISALPDLSAVFYAAGTVKEFAEPFLRNNVRVVSAWAANAVPVGEFTMAQMILAANGYFAATMKIRQEAELGWRRSRATGFYGITIALLGAGMVGREVIRRLADFDVEVVVFDPYLHDAEAEVMGVQKVSLQDAFANATIVSNHLANVPETRGIITGDLLASMMPHSTFINTGRGDTVNEPDMIRVLSERSDITALLDVTTEEPPASGNRLYNLPNVWISPHIAGSIGNEVVRMSDYMIEEFERELAGRPLRFEVNEARLATMA